MDDIERAVSVEIGKELESANSYHTSVVTRSRERALNAFDLEPVDELKAGSDDLSKATTSLLSDSITWKLPVLLSRLHADGAPVLFPPSSIEDEDRAELETSVCNTVLTVLNDGYTAQYEAIQDCLLAKTGIFKVWYDSSKTNVQESRDGLAEQDLNVLESMQAQGLISALDYGPSGQRPIQASDQMGRPVTVGMQPVYSARFRSHKPVNKVAISSVDPDNFRINKDHREPSATNARFTAERIEISPSALVAQGIDKSVVDKLPKISTSRSSTSGVQRARDKKTGGNELSGKSNLVEVWEVYLMLDADEDGLDERYRCLWSDASKTVLELEEVAKTPYAILPGTRLRAHRFFGSSDADLILKLYVQQSQVMRQMLDGVWFGNHPRPICAPGVDMDSLNDHRPGNPVKVGNKQGFVDRPVSDYIGTLQLAHDQQSSERVFQLIAEQAEGRTGVGRQSMGLDLKTLGSNTGDMTAMSMMRAAEKLVDHCCELFARTGYADLMQLIHYNLRMFHNEPMQGTVRGKKVMTVPAREWQERLVVEPDIPDGPLQKAEKAMALEKVMADQKELKQIAPEMVPASVMHNTREEWAKCVGLQNFSLYQDPQSPPAQQQMLQQAQQQIQQLTQQIQQLQQAPLMQQAQTERMKAETDRWYKQQSVEMDTKKIGADIVADAREDELKYGADVPGSGV